MPAIVVSNLSRVFKTYNKEEGGRGTLRNLFRRKYIDLYAVKDISFKVEEGELIGFIGPNGAGKTTTLKMLSGLLFPTNGEIDVLGYKPFDRRPEFLMQLSLIMGNRNQLWSDLTAIDTFRLNKEIYKISDREFKRMFTDLTELLEIGEIIYRPVRKMSLGQRMKCELIASLLHKPRILFLDEPTLGLDVVMQKKLREFIKDYNSKYNSTVLLTSHYMDDVKEVCNRVIIINAGVKLFDGSLANLIKEHAGYKTLSVTFNDEINTSLLTNIGQVEVTDSFNAQIRVKKEDVPSVAHRILSDFDIDDLDINEPSLEVIIREIFEKPINTLI
jgi:ABC-2 type transport system ATP-binding protein